MNELAVATEAARKAGAIIRRFTLSRQQALVKSDPRDLVTHVDRGAERAIRETILHHYPKHEILGEEEGGSLSSDSLWIVDPLDGTTNFVQTLPFFAVSIAFAYRGVVEVGVVYDPIREELFYAQRGHGAFLNTKPIHVDPAPLLSASTVATRTPIDPATGAVENLEAYRACACQARAMRNLGAAALELAWVASGRLTAYWEMHLNAWDRAAGALLVAEAGGQVTQPDGSPLPLIPVAGVLASNGTIHADLVTVINQPRSTISSAPAGEIT
ncbi:MAG TPA: inositol monophosphatase family protein [Symbiobacteriaceae bacterium]|nr:inositol monophosphatase family protein [Symbiobacteriaceae bacterium]